MLRTVYAKFVKNLCGNYYVFLNDEESLDDTQVTTIRSGEGYAKSPPLVIFVQAPENLAGPLRQALFNRVGTIAPFSTMALTERQASDPGSAALVVVADRRAYIWTPVYATADLSVRVAFASDGRVDWDQLGEIDKSKKSPARRRRLFCRKR